MVFLSGKLHTLLASFLSRWATVLPYLIVQFKLHLQISCISFSGLQEDGIPATYCLASLVCLKHINAKLKDSVTLMFYVFFPNPHYVDDTKTTISLSSNQVPWTPFAGASLSFNSWTWENTLMNLYEQGTLMTLFYQRKAFQLNLKLYILVPGMSRVV